MNTTRQLLRLVPSLLIFLAASFVPKAFGDPFPPVVHLLAVDPDAAEAGSDPADFIVLRVGPTNVPLTVYYDIGGTASNCIDYLPLSGVVTIPSGSFFAPVTVTPFDDDLIEGNETVLLGLHQPLEWPPPYLVSWPSIGLAQIEDNDFPPTNHPPLVRIVSPPDGATFESPLDLPIIARANDPDGRVRTVEFFADGTSLGIVTNRPPVTRFVPIATDDSVLEIEPDLYPDVEADPIDATALLSDWFRLVWTNVPAGVHVLVAVATDNQNATGASQPVTIKVHEPPPVPVVTVRATDPTATEPGLTASRIDTATFTIHRTGRLDSSLTVFYRLSGTASNGVDYRELPHLATMDPGECSVDVLVIPRDDNLVEGRESVVLTLVAPPCVDAFPQPPDCYVVGRPHVARAVIYDNDQTNLPPFVRLVRPLDGSVFIAPAQIKLVAEARDFDGRVVTVEFFEGTNSLGIVTNNPISVTNTQPPFMLVWSNVPPGRYVLSAEATDNDGATSQSRPVEIKVVPRLDVPVVSIETSDPIASEPGVLTVIDTASFVVSRTGDTDRPLLVYYAIGGTALNGVDYSELSGKVIIPAGAAKTNIVVNALDDRLVEGTETVVIKLERGHCLNLASPLPPDCYLVGTNYHARAIIRDNDFPPTNSPPKVEIVKPQDGDLFRAFADIPIYAAAIDPDGYVHTVEFIEGTNSLGIVTNNLSPIVIGSNAVPDPVQIFRLVWSNVPPGGYVLTARAVDNRGAKSVSEPVHIRVLAPPLPPVVTIYATDPVGSEGDWLDVWPADVLSADLVRFDLPDPARFTVARSGGTNVDLTVYYALGGSALNGVDYQLLSGKVVIPRGAWKADIVVRPIDDKLIEGTESVRAKLLPVACIAIDPPPPDCYVVGDPAGAVAYIRDNDFNFSPRVAITEPPDGAVFPAAADIKIEVLTRDPDGYVTKVEFFAGTNLIGVQEMLFIVPPPPGQLQRFSMVWTNVPVGAYALTARATDNHGAMTTSEPIRIKVVERPPLPIVTIVAVDPIASEQNPLTDVAPDPGIFKVSRLGDLSRALKVFYRVGGTASNGVDYVSLPGELVLPVGEASAPLIVNVLDDLLVEGTESVVVELIQPPCLTTNTPAPDGCYLVGQPRRDVVYIRDNDSPPNQLPKVAIISPPDGSVFEAPVDIRLLAAADDRDGWVATVEFFAGTNSLGIVTNRPWILDPVNLDSLRVASLTNISPINPFVLVWSNAPVGHHVLTAVATDNVGGSSRSAPVDVTVVGSNTIPVVNILAIDAFAREGTLNTATFRVRRRGPTNDALTVSYSIGGTAANGIDYTAIPGSVTIPAGRFSARIRITPIDDRIPEPIETVILRLQPPTTLPPAYLVGRPARAGAIIVDNDCGTPETVRLPDGRIHARLQADVGVSYRLETSTDLATWETLFRNISIDAESGFVDDEAPQFSRRFYRLEREPLVLEDD